MDVTAQLMKRIPFTKDELDSRVSKLGQAISDVGVNLEWLSSPDSMYYFTGYRASWYRMHASTSWPPFFVQENRVEFLHNSPRSLIEIV